MTGGLSKEFIDYFCLMEEAKNSLPSKSLKAYLDSDEYWDCFISNRDKGWSSFPSWSCLQLLTIAFNYMSSRKRVRFIRRIAKKMDCFPEEKAFIRMCARDLAKNKYRGMISGRTLKSYDKHFNKIHSTINPLDEPLFLPVIFKTGDVVVFRDKRERPHYCIVLTRPDYKSDKIANHSDESYTVRELNPEKFISKQYQVLVEELQRIPGLKVTKIENVLRTISKQYAEDLKKRFSAGLDYLKDK